MERERGKKLDGGQRGGDYVTRGSGREEEERGGNAGTRVF
jgi:hypothetical protein